MRNTESKKNCRTNDEKIKLSYANIEDAIRHIFCRKNKLSGNKIPIRIRKLMRRKKALSKRMITTREC